jgi:hypothetical protein
MLHAQLCDQKQRNPSAVHKIDSDLTTDTTAKTNAALPAGQGLFRSCPNGTRAHNSVRCILGILLIAGSFLVYLAYPVVLFALPFSMNMKVGAAVAVWLVSWGAFSTGIFLAGPAGFKRLKRFCSRTMAKGVMKPN